MKFDINKLGIAWTSAFIMWNLAFILDGDGDGIVIYVSCMIGQTLLLFVFLWLFTKKRKIMMAIEKCRKEMSELEEQRRQLDGLEEQKRKLKQIIEEYKNGMA